MFTAGRYEYRNKGVDMFIESLARLNHRLKTANSNTTVVAFIIMPAATHSYTVEALKGQAVTKQLRDTVTEIQNRIGQRIFEKAARFSGESGTEVPAFDELLSDEDRVLLKRRIFALKRNSLPPITTHNMGKCTLKFRRAAVAESCFYSRRFCGPCPQPASPRTTLQ